MSDEERRALARRAGDGDLEAAVDLVRMLLRAAGPAPQPTLRSTKIVDESGNAYTVHEPPTADELRGVPLLCASGTWCHGRLNETSAALIKLERWLVVHSGRVIRISHDPIGFAAGEPPELVRELERQIKRLLQFRGVAIEIMRGAEARRFRDRLHRRIMEWRSERSRCRDERSAAGRSRADHIEAHLERLLRLSIRAEKIWVYWISSGDTGPLP